MRAEILSVGTELLLGDIVNTDAQYVARELAAFGITVHYQVVVGDNMDRLTATLRQALSRSDLVITTGGLGPTVDDITCEGICRVLGVKRVLDTASLEKIQVFFEKLGREMTENNVKQAMLPEGCEIFDNEWGTAPGCVIEKNGKAVIMLPGPPREMRHMFDRSVRPWLQKRSELVIVSHTLHVFGVGESKAEAMTVDLMQGENPTVAPYAKTGEMQLRVTARAASKEVADAMCRPMMEELQKRLGNAVYGVDVENLETAVVEKLKAAGKTVACAESCTGGLLAKRMTDISGASAVFENSFITYSNEKKTNLLGVPPKTLQKYGAVSEQTACAMAIGARKAGRADYGVGITGIAGPTGGTAEKPVGLVYIAVADEKMVWVKKVQYAKENDRSYVRIGSASHALNMLRLLLDKDQEFLKTGIALNKKSRGEKFLKEITPWPVATGRPPKRPGFVGFLSEYLPWKGDRFSDVLFKLLLLAAVAAFLFSVWYLVDDQLIKPNQNDNLYSQLAGDYTRSDSSTSPIAPPAPDGTEDGEEGSTAPVVEVPDWVPASFADLYRNNPDVRGYIQVPGTRMNYPVTQAADNEYYLNRNFYKRRSVFGNPYFDYRNKIDGTDRNLIIYGHRVENGQMFGDMEKYKDLSYYQQHAAIQMDTVYQTGDYEIVSVFYASTREEHAPNFNYLRTDFASDENFLSFVDEVRKRSLYDIPVTVDADDELLTLSSCSFLFDDARIVIVARRLQEGETAVNPALATVNEDCLMPEIWYQLHPEIPHP